MGNVKDGGPAFPIYTPDMNVGDYAGPGMSLRDWFAGQIFGCVLIGAESYTQAAQLAYEAADALLLHKETKP